MATKENNAERLHSELNDIVVDVVLKALRGQCKTADSALDWEDVEKIVGVVAKAFPPIIIAGAWGGLSFGLDDEHSIFGEALNKHYSCRGVDLADLIAGDVEIRRDAGGEDAEFSSDPLGNYREAFAASIAKAEALLAKG